jgi:sugar/nucleoside kinase (ribokinase family)
VNVRRLVFAGEALVDVVLRVPALPERGGDVFATSSEVTVGGGFNVMAAAARQGLPVLYAGGHGTGPWGDLVRAALAAEGITILRPPDPARDTGFDVALVEPDGERTFATHVGAETVGRWDDVPAGAGDMVYVSGYGLAARGGAREEDFGGQSSGTPPRISPAPPASPLFVDPGPLVAQISGEILDQVLARCDWLSCNDREAALLTGGAEAADAARLLLERTARASVIVRTGASGCVLALRGEEIARIPAPVVEVIDTTGAGDTHAGVFIAALGEGLTPAQAASRANAAAAFSVTRPGPATSPTRATLDAWLAPPPLGKRGRDGVSAALFGAAPRPRRNAADTPQAPRVRRLHTTSPRVSPSARQYRAEAKKRVRSE